MNMGRVTAAEISEISKSRNPSAAEYDGYRAHLRDEYGTWDLPPAVDDALYGKAYEMGHSAGYREIEVMYGDLADLVLLAFYAN